MRFLLSCEVFNDWEPQRGFRPRPSVPPYHRVFSLMAETVYWILVSQPSTEDEHSCPCSCSLRRIDGPTH